MKKIICVFIASILVFAMTACGGSKEPQSATLKLSVDGVTISYQLDAKGDIVQTMTQVSTLEKAAFTYADVDSFEASFAEYQVIYDAIEGVTYSTESTDTELIETIVMDVSDSDTLQALIDQGLLPVEGNTKRISLSSTVESLEAQGWTIVK